MALLLMRLHKWGARTYDLDFRDVRACSPTAMLLLSSRLAPEPDAGRELTLVPRNYGHLRYEAHMGLFRAVGVIPDPPRQRETYAQLTEVSRDTLAGRAREAGRSLEWAIEDEARRVARLLLQQDEGEDVDLLTYCLDEIFRNVFDHGRVAAFRYCGQYWPRYGIVEVGIEDLGIGLLKSLSANRRNEIETDEHAVQAAVLPGVSGRNLSRNTRSEYDEGPGNAGLGLYMTSRLCMRGGRFSVSSGTAILAAHDRHQHIRRTNVPGTTLCLRLRVDGSDFSELRRELLRTADELGRTIKRNAVTPQLLSQLRDS